MHIWSSRDRNSARRWNARGPSTRFLTCMLLLALLLSWSRLGVPVAAEQPAARLQQEEPSPIDVELIAPAQAGPGTEIEVSLKYDVVDPNAGADLNYNVFGPVDVLAREPAPPNPAYNTWLPGKETAQGTISIRLRVRDGTAGETIVHQVEVRWGIKTVKFETRTQVNPLPPPTATPRPRPRLPAATVAPTPTAESAPAEAEVELVGLALFDLDGQPLSVAEANQEIALGATYASTRDAQGLTFEIAFEPDVVNLDLPQGDNGYIYAPSTLPAAPSGAPLFDPPLGGRIRFYEGGGDTYSMRATVRVRLPEGAAGEPAQELASESIEINQVLSLRLSIRTEVESVVAGESFIVHAQVENLGGVSASQIRLALAGLAAGFVVSPAEQTIEQLAAGGEAESRVFTVRSPEDYDGRVDFYAVAMTDEAILESGPLTVVVSAPKPLRLEVSTSATSVYAGDAAYVDVTATNESEFEALAVAAKLIDVSGNLGVLLQEVGDIPAGDSHEWMFVVQIPEDFPIDTVASLVVQTISEDGVTSQSPEIELVVACRPRFEAFVEPPAGRLRGGDSAEAIALVKNTGQCAARNVSVALIGLPASFAQLPAQQIIELAPGQARYATFNVLIPQGYRGEVPLIVEASTEQGAKSQSPPIQMSVSGPSPAIAIVFGILVLVVAIAGIMGLVLYFRNR